jgi:hypothetical protein
MGYFIRNASQFQEKKIFFSAILILAAKNAKEREEEKDKNYKFQITNYKQITIPKLQTTKPPAGRTASPAIKRRPSGMFLTPSAKITQPAFHSILRFSPSSRPFVCLRG